MEQKWWHAQNWETPQTVKELEVSRVSGIDHDRRESGAEGFKWITNSESSQNVIFICLIFLSVYLKFPTMTMHF